MKIETIGVIRKGLTIVLNCSLANFNEIGGRHNVSRSAFAFFVQKGIAPIAEEPIFFVGEMAIAIWISTLVKKKLLITFGAQTTNGVSHF